MDMGSLRSSGQDTVAVSYDASLDQAIVDELTRRIPWVVFSPAAEFAGDEPLPDLVVAAGPGLFLLDALEAGVPAIVPTGEETRRYVREGGGVLTGPDAESLAEGVLRVVSMAPAARRVMGRIGRNHLLALVG